MGNLIPCSSGRAAAEILVVLPGGEAQKFHSPIKAAELMIQHSPLFFVANLRSLHAGRRFCPLSADEDLELGESYVMFPMKRLNSVAVDADVAGLIKATKSEAIKVTSSRCKSSKEDEKIGIAGFEGGGGGTMGVEGGRLDQSGLQWRLNVEMRGNNYGRLSSCRSRRPSLETIVEEREPLCSR